VPFPESRPRSRVISRRHSRDSNRPCCSHGPPK
jgi:hypothetical protein